MIGQRRDRAWWPLLTSEPIISILFGPHPFEKAICIRKPYKNAWNMPMSQTLLSRSDRPRGKLSVGSFRSYRGGTSPGVLHAVLGQFTRSALRLGRNGTVSRAFTRDRERYWQSNEDTQCALRRASLRIPSTLC